jgi:hypothetical protein
MDVNTLVFWVVVLGRFFIPLAIPRYPLPGILAALVLDAIDQTIFQVFTTLPLDDYQGYDKALDIYYLTVAYVSTLRNWTNLFAVSTSRVLWYYRLLGVTLFELTGARWLLLIFPNTFEYFFIFYELVQLRWNPQRLSRRTILRAAAFIWIFIKLPHEFWIHVLQLDATDFLKTTVLGAELSTPWSQVLARNLWVVPALLLLLAAIVWLGRWLLQRLPQADRLPVFHAARYRYDHHQLRAMNSVRSWSENFLNAALLEKMLLVTLVCLIFGAIMPNLRVSAPQLAVGVAIIVVLNSLVSQWLRRRGRTYESALAEYVTMAAVNMALAMLYILLLPQLNGAVNTRHMLFFVLLLTLIVILFDYYHPVYRKRRVEAGDKI